MCEPSRICCGRFPYAIINQPPNFLKSQIHQSLGPVFPASQQSQTCGFGVSSCLPTCCHHPSVCLPRHTVEPPTICYFPCPCPVRCRCAGDCCQRNYCSPPFMPPFV